MLVRYYGHFQLPSGYGHAARELAKALDAADVEQELVTVGPRQPGWEPEDLAELYVPALDRGPAHPVDPDVAIVHTLPGDCHRVLEAAGLRRGAGPKLVAYTTWEALTAPLDIVQPLYDCFDQVWTPSRASALALGSNGLHGSGRDRARAELVTHVVPHCYDDSEVRPSGSDGNSEEFRRKFRFYWVGAWTARKNPAGLIRAFAHAFYPGADVELVLHSPGVSLDTFVATLATTGLEQDALPPIVISTQYLTWGSLARFHAEADVFVSAARGEAWNLPAFDALLAGRHVITQYGLGSDEFLADTSADLVDGWEAPAQVDVTMASSDGGEMTVKTIGAQGLSSRSLWLEPNLSSLAEAMRSAYESRKRTIKIDYDVAARFGYAAVAELVLKVLET
jgi:glycosyltransferase involved in cell wall biosynthesis